MALLAGRYIHIPGTCRRRWSRILDRTLSAALAWWSWPRPPSGELAPCCRPRAAWQDLHLAGVATVLATTMALAALAGSPVATCLKTSHGRSAPDGRFRRRRQPRPRAVRVRAAMVHNFGMSQGPEPIIAPDKKTLRRLLRAQRRSLAPQRDRRVDGDAIAAAVSTLLDTTARSSQDTGEHRGHERQPCVAIYRSQPLEPPTGALAEMLHARPATVIVPETLPDFDLEWHELHADGGEGPRLGLEGIAAAHLILTPALSVDQNGNRLGQGGGCYDRALVRRRLDALIVAIVYDQELAGSRLPQDAYDVRVQAVITPDHGFAWIPGQG